MVKFSQQTYFRAVLIGCVFSALPLRATNTYISYPNFSNTNGLTFVGNTATTTTSDGKILRLNGASGYQEGAAYSTSAIGLGANATFSTQFQFRFTNPGGIDPADGITFVVAAGSAGLGSAGGGLGYSGVGNSVAIEFDTYNNGGGDGNSSNHVAFDENGSLNSLNLAYVYGIQTCDFGGGTLYTAAGCLSNGDLWTANITYDGSHLNATVFDPAKGYTFTALNNYAVNIGSVLGVNSAFVGFTGSTGSGFENQDIVDWQFSNSATLPVAIPEPGSHMLITLASLLAIVGTLVRKSRNFQT